MDLDVKHFQYGALRVFSAYRPSNLQTCKWQALDHFVAEFRDIRKICVLRERHYESGHRFVRILYRKGSKRTTAPMKETVYLPKKARIVSTTVGKPHCLRHASFVRHHAVKLDGGLLVRNEFFATWLDIGNAKKVVYYNTIDRLGGDAHIKCFVSSLDEDVAIVFLELLHLCLVDLITDGRSVIHVPLLCPA